MASNKTLPNRGNGLSRPSPDQAKIADDITRIAGFLDAQRSTSSQRTTGLAQELSHRREHVARDMGAAGGAGPAKPNSTPADMVSRADALASELRANPVLAERYHAFCHDLDLMLAGFRARVDGEKPIKH